MNLSDREQTFLIRGLDKATTPDEADTCARNFFKELRARGAESYQILAQLDEGEDYMPYESEGTPEFAEMTAYSDYIGHENWKRQNEAREKGIPFEWRHVSYEEFRKWYDANKDAKGRVPRPNAQQTPQAAPKASSEQPGTSPYWRSGRPKTAETPRPQHFDFSIPVRSQVVKHPPVQTMSNSKLVSLLILNFALAFVCFHGIFATLIFGSLLAIPMIGSKWFRRLLLVLVLWFFGAIFWSSWQANQQMRQQAQAYAAAQGGQ